MFSRTENTGRSNHSIFLPQNFGSPFNDTAEHISGLGLARLDFERGAVAGEVIYSVEGDSTPICQQDEETRIATLACALKKLGNSEDTAEFMRCLNGICKEGDARYRHVAASYYYGEIAERGAASVLKEMALIAMHLASLNPIMEGVESDSEMVSFAKIPIFSKYQTSPSAPATVGTIIQALLAFISTIGSVFKLHRVSFAKTRSPLLSATWEMGCNVGELGYMRPKRGILESDDILAKDRFRQWLRKKNSESKDGDFCSPTKQWPKSVKEGSGRIVRLCPAS